MIPHFLSDAWQHVFNTPLECGLRSTALLLAAYPARCDLQRLVEYEYLLVHSGDVDSGPPSLHPAAPHRAGELFVRRELVERGLLFMMSRNIVCRELSEQGIHYFAGEDALAFFDSLGSQYSLELRKRAEWVVNRFGGIKDEELNNFMREKWAHWGSEFTNEIFVRGERA